MSDWSGTVTVNSLPHEVKTRQALNARLLEAAVAAPNVRVGESRVGRPAGLPVRVEEMIGGATKVTVDSLSWSKILPSPSASGPVLGQEPLDPYSGMSRNAFNRAKFFEFFVGQVGRVPVTEIGPKAGNLGATGI